MTSNSLSRLHDHALLRVVFIQASAGIRQHGGLALANNRDNLPPPNTFQRARQAPRRQSCARTSGSSSPLVLIAAIAGHLQPMDHPRRAVFFFARVAHAIIYLAGWPLHPSALLVRRRHRLRCSSSSLCSGSSPDDANPHARAFADHGGGQPRQMAGESRRQDRARPSHRRDRDRQGDDGSRSRRRRHGDGAARSKKARKA